MGRKVGSLSPHQRPLVRRILTALRYLASLVPNLSMVVVLDQENPGMYK